MTDSDTIAHAAAIIRELDPGMALLFTDKPHLRGAIVEGMYAAMVATLPGRADDARQWRDSLRAMLDPMRAEAAHDEYVRAATLH